MKKETKFVSTPMKGIADDVINVKILHLLKIDGIEIISSTNLDFIRAKEKEYKELLFNKLNKDEDDFEFEILEVPFY